MNNLNTRSNLSARKSGRLSVDSDEEHAEHNDSGQAQLGQFYSMFEGTMKDISSSVRSMKDTATSIVKEYPFYTILGALAVGFAAGAALRVRKSH